MGRTGGDETGSQVDPGDICALRLLTSCLAGAGDWLRSRRAALGELVEAACDEGPGSAVLPGPRQPRPIGTPARLLLDHSETPFLTFDVACGALISAQPAHVRTDSSGIDGSSALSVELDTDGIGVVRSAYVGGLTQNLTLTGLVRTGSKGIDANFTYAAAPPSSVHAGGLDVDNGFTSKLVRSEGLGTDGSLASAVAPPSRRVHAGGLGVQGGFVNKPVRTGDSKLVDASGLGAGDGFVSKPVRTEGLGDRIPVLI